jgi:hypothetical protein
VIGALSEFQQVLWAVNVAVEATLAALLVVRKNYRLYPAFFFYILLVLAQNVVGFVTYRQWGYNSVTAWRIFSLTLGVLICARALAVAEVCRHLLRRFRGIWALAWRFLLVCAAFVLLYSLLFSKHEWTLVVSSADRGLEFAIATVIVALLLFASHYQMDAEPADRWLAVGLCLFSCFSVINDTILERWLYQAAALWNVLDMLTYLASLLLWIWALRKALPAAAPEQSLLPGSVYQTFVPEINLRLRLLNKQLSQFWKVEAPEL